MVGKSILLTRDRQGALHAFANFCRHRGTRLADGKGNCKVLTCPYHGWSFAHSGELVGVPGMEQTKGFDRKHWNLLALRLESWAGFLFVNFDREAEPLAAYLGNLPERFASYRFEDFVCVRRKEYDIACNWKVYLENAMEDYHTPVVHKNSIGLQQTTTEQETRRGNWDAIFMPAKRTIAVLPEEIDALPACAVARGQARGRHLLHRDLSLDLLRLDPGLHVVAAIPAAGRRQDPRLDRLLLPALDRGACRISPRWCSATTSAGTSRCPRTTGSPSASNRGSCPR